MNNADLFNGLFDELHSLGAAIGNIAAEIENSAKGNVQMVEWANRLYTEANTATRLAVVRPTQQISTSGIPSPAVQLASSQG